MKNDISLKMLEQLNTDISIELGPLPSPGNKFSTYQTPLMKSLIGNLPSEIANEIEKLKIALAYLSSDVGRGNGTFYDASGNPEEDYWLAAIWAGASLGPLAKDVMRDWSKKCPARYDEHGFEIAWNSYKANHSNPIGIGSLYKRAIEFGWQKAQPSEPTTSTGVYKLLTGYDLRALPPV